MLSSRILISCQLHEFVDVMYKTTIPSVSLGLSEKHGVQDVSLLAKGSISDTTGTPLPTAAWALWEAVMWAPRQPWLEIRAPASATY